VSVVGSRDPSGDPGRAVMDDAADTSGVLVVGYGNVLRGDDGVGWAVVARLSRDPRFHGLQTRAQHQLTPELALDASRAALVILVDASVVQAPGSVEVRRLDPAHAAGTAWTHHLEPDSLVALASELWGASPAVLVVSVGIASLETGDRLSPAVEAAVPRAVDAIARLVREHGRA
jgi:hydrogenase maturation protease